MNICKINDCYNMAIAKGACDKHYRRFKKYGSYSLPLRIPKYDNICIEDGCDNQSKTIGYCTMHYTRLLRNGDTKKVNKHISKNGIRYKDMPEYTVWSNMKSRCYKESNNQYKNYGGRGIKVCDEWINNFPKFLQDIGRRPTSKHRIDRIDNNSGYTINNCRWVTNKVNCNNTRRNKYITYNGETKTYTEWSESLGGNTHLVYDRIRLGWSEESAVTKPFRKIKKAGTS